VSQKKTWHFYHNLPMFHGVSQKMKVARFLRHCVCYVNTSKPGYSERHTWTSSSKLQLLFSIEIALRY